MGVEGSRVVSRRGLLRAGGGLAAVAGLAGCSGLTKSSSGGGSKSGHGGVSISLADVPATTEPWARQPYLASMAAYEKSHPRVSIHNTTSIALADLLKTLPAKLANGTMYTAFPLPFAQASTYGDKGQLAYVTDIVQGWSHYDEMDERYLDTVRTADGKLYGFPFRGDYFGFVYSRKRFTEVGLDPDNPPTTWQEFRAAAKRLTNPSKNQYGTCFSKGIGGAWWYSGWVYSGGGRIMERKDGRFVAAMDTPANVKTLQFLKDLRWTDQSLSPKLYTSILTDILPDLANGRIAMAITSPAGSLSVEQYGGKPKDFGYMAFPQDGGNATLAEGNSYQFPAKGASRAQIKAAFDFVAYMQFDPGVQEAALKAAVAAKQPVGTLNGKGFVLKEGSPLRKKLDALQAKYATIPAANVRPYLEGSKGLKLVGEAPVNSQEFYLLFGPLLEGVFTSQTADVKGILQQINKDIQSRILAHQ